MKLGEALSLRARQAQQLEDLRGRIRANALTQEGDNPAEDPDELIEQFLKLSSEHEQLVQRIALTNMATTVPDGEGTTLLLTLLHAREGMRRARSIHEVVAVAGTPTRDAYRYMRSELRYVSQVDVAEHRRLAEEWDTKIRELDARIQEENWKIDLL